MSNLSTQHLINCIIEKDKYKQTQQYLKEVQLDNESAYNFINEALYNILTTSNYPPSAKLYALRFLKELFINAQFHFIDELHDNIMKHIIKTSQFDKENTDKGKRGSLYFQQAEKRKKQSDLEKLSYSYVLFSTEIVYVMGVWHALDQNNQTSDYAIIYDKLKKAKVPFPQNDKELKFFKPQEKDLFLKNYKEWVQKLPQIEEESQEVDDKENCNQKSKKSIRSNKKITQPDEPKYKTTSQTPLLSKDQNKATQKSQIKTKGQDPKPNNNPQELKILQMLNDSKDKEISKMQQRIDVLSNKNKELQEKISQLEGALKATKDSNSTQSKIEQQKLKIKFIASQNKYSTLENKYLALQKEANLLKSKLEESQSLRQRQAVQLQQQKHSLKKIYTEKTENEQKCKNTIEESRTELKQAVQKIARLEREIQQLNTIKKSYKTIIEQNRLQEKDIPTNEKQQQTKINQLQQQIEETVQFYTKQIIQLKSQISELKTSNQELQNLIESKDTQMRSLSSQIHGKSKQISYLKANLQNLQLETNNQAKRSYLLKQKQQCGQFQSQVPITVTIKTENPLSYQLNNIKPELKTQIQQRRENSMSDYLFSQAISVKHYPSTLQMTRQQSQAENRQASLIEKIKNKSLGKTQKSQEKLRHKKQRFSAGKTFHFTNHDQRKIHQSAEMNSKRLQHVNLSIKKPQPISYGNLCKQVTRADEYIKFDHQQSFCKKSSALYLERKPYFKDYLTPKPNAIQTMVPFIENYFSQKSNMSYHDLAIFKSLCLSRFVRERQPIFVDHNIQAKLLASSSGSKELFILQVMNTCYSSIKVKAVSCHDQFKIVGEKLRFVHSNSTVEYQIETRNKDLNLRYPIVSLIVSQDEGNRTKNIVYNVPLPLSLVEFTEMKKEIPEFYELEGSKVKLFKSETFSLNSRFQSLRQLFPHLSFTQKSQSAKMQLRKAELTWQGNLLHSFIQNVDTYFKMSQVGSQVTLELAVRDYDVVSQNYAKAMIQTLMFLLQ